MFQTGLELDTKPTARFTLIINIITIHNTIRDYYKGRKRQTALKNKGKTAPVTNESIIPTRLE